MKKWLLRILYAFIALMPVAVWADYNATVGSGTVIFAFTCFTTKVCPAHVITNSAGTEINTTSNPAQVQVGDGSNQVPIKAASTAAAAADKSFVTNESPNSLLTTTVNGASATTAHGCSVAGYGVLGCLGQIDDDVKGSIPAGSNLIGKVGIDQTTPGTTNLVALTSSQVGAGATGSAPPANSVYLGANASGATGGHLAGLISCDNHVFKHITTATDTLAVQGVASQTIYVCAWRSRAAGVATWFLENTASANANCSSTLTQINGVATEAANTGETWGSNFWSGLKNTSGNGLCINSTGTGGVDVDIFYTQF